MEVGKTRSNKQIKISSLEKLEDANQLSNKTLGQNNSSLMYILDGARLICVQTMILQHACWLNDNDSSKN